MRVKLLVNLKIETGETIGAETIFDDEKENFPDFVLSNLDNPKIIKEIPIEIKSKKAPIKPNLNPSSVPSVTMDGVKESTPQKLVKRKTK